MNARLPGEVGRRFSEFTREVEQAPEAALARLQDEGDRLCEEFARDPEPSYAVKYNRFMAVRTDAPGT